MRDAPTPGLHVGGGGEGGYNSSSEKPATLGIWETPGEKLLLGAPQVTGAVIWHIPITAQDLPRRFAPR